MMEFSGDCISKGSNGAALRNRSANMATRASCEKKYGANAYTVLSSKNQVAAAARWGDDDRVSDERARHYKLMESLPS